MNIARYVPLNFVVFAHIKTLKKIQRNIKVFGNLITDNLIMKIEEKAKVYDGNYKTYTELINRLEGVKDAIKKQNYGIAMDILCKPYPEYQITTSTELKESEDERIRKALIDYHKRGLKDSPWFTQELKHQEVLAWLEKQGKQKFADGTFVNVDDVREDFIQEVYRVLDADSTNDRANQIIDAFDNLPTVAIEKQGEQNPQIKLVFPKFRVGDIIQHIPLEKWDTTNKITHIDETGYYFDYSHQGDTVSSGFIGFLSENDYELVEQKSAWSKEDDMVLNLILDSIQREGVLEKKRKTDWLKSLKCRVQPQPMQGWSEEDEKMFNDAIGAIGIADYYTYDDKQEIENWLKSLKDKYTWKPSDEQILAIETVINVVGKDTLSGKHLIELLEQLKTL